MSSQTPLIDPVLTSSASLVRSANNGNSINQNDAAKSKMATEFESVFFSLLIKNMRNSMTEEGLFGSEASDTYGGLFDMYMGQHLSESNDLGISGMLESYVNNQQTGENHEKRPASNAKEEPN